MPTPGIGVLNIGGTGRVVVDGREFVLAARECLYIGRGSREVEFASESAEAPARMCLISYPAHAAFPTEKATLNDARRIEVGHLCAANRRTIHQYIHEAGIAVVSWSWDSPNFTKGAFGTRTQLIGTTAAARYTATLICRPMG